MRSRNWSAASSEKTGTSIWLGDVIGFFIRSNNVETDSTLGLRRLRGLESNCTKGISTSDITPAAPATQITRLRLRVMKSSSGPSALKPTSSSSPFGLSSRISAGNMVIDSAKATIMPMPATIPNSATPV